MNILIKICGIKTKSAALASAKFGADFLGFNFVFSSKRKIMLNRAQGVVKSLAKKSRPKLVAVFMNQSADYINQILSQIKFDMLQFHGRESPEFCASFGRPYIKVFGVDKKTSVKDLSDGMSKYKAKYFILDRKNRGKGAIIDIAKVKKLAARFPVVLAGGLTPQNIKSIIAKAGKIKGVDVAGGVEVNNKKSLKKIKEFIDISKI